jgi:Protein of unknown function (DUF2652)/Polyketide cyclase / dehydrase and lipid transport
VLSRPESACLLIADISGYTRYLAGSELDHAQDILADLMTTVVGALRPGYRLAKLEGDAAFAYMLTDRIDGSQLLDTIERTYFAFRRRLRDISQATSCECNACVLMPRLDLKFIAHHGSVIRHKIAGREELVGSDVIVAHRLLKNHVVERFGIPAYALFSGACIAAMGVDPVALGMTGYTDTYDDMGEVEGSVHDLGAAWTAEQQLRRVVVAERDAGYVFEDIQPAPRDIVWSFMTDPAMRPRWQAGVTGVDELPTSPRRGIGTTNHCMHGKDVVVEEILDWRPTDYVTLRSTLSNGFQAVTMYAFHDAPGGTQVRILFTWGKNRREREEATAVREFLADVVGRGQAALHDLLVAEMAHRATLAADTPPEPVTPGSLDREILEPVKR